MDKFTGGWVKYLRQNSPRQPPQQQQSQEQPPPLQTRIPHRQQQHNDSQALLPAEAPNPAGHHHTLVSCTACRMQIENTKSAFQSHIDAHQNTHFWRTSQDVDNAFADMQAKPTPPSQDTIRSVNRKRGSGTLDNLADPSALSGSGPGTTEADPRGHKKQRSPPASLDRSRARVDDAQDFDRGHAHKNIGGRELFDPNRAKTPDFPLGLATSKKVNTPAAKANRPTQQSVQDPASQEEDEEEDPSVSKMVLQPETRPISQDQLVAEVKGIYAGLVMVETKCIEVDNAQSNTDANSKLNNEQWQALIALHRTLLHEHHDFFLASQHPSASPALRRLASKYAMPARMWRHGIHSFLELLRHRLPVSLEHMLTFLYLAYSMMALLYETVPAFEDTWIECLGDLGRYRMAIEDDDIRDREVWTGVSRHWYSKASDKAPTTGRLYHHLAILARPNALQQLYYYAKSLCVPIPFLSARESIMTLFNPVLESSPTSRLSPVDAAFVRVHGILFSGKFQDKLQDSMDEFIELLDSHIGRTTKRWLESGYYIGIALGCSLLEYGVETNVLMRAMSQRPEDADVPMEGSSVSEATPSETFKNALSFAVRTWDAVLCRWGDTNTLPCIHTTLMLIYHMSRIPAAMVHLERAYPWNLTALMLNSLLGSCEFEPRLDSDEFPRPEKEELPRPLPEDHAMKGLLYADHFPSDWFNSENTDEDEKFFELASMVDQRKERIIWLGRMISASGKWLTWDLETRKFAVTPEFDDGSD